ncbi:MAG: 1-acyl-sn-glycerol-3-phosphate acyltransferase [Clostridia bacterium]|nr:1-acyl-sn-glycerol-3-phosphate acyltransferase [Clostridia bacterium]
MSTERSQDRLAVLSRIAEYEAAGIFDRDVEDDPPTRPLDYRRVDYLGKRLSTKIGTAIANRVATAHYERMIRRGEFLLGEVRGLENFEAVKGGALLTANHFSPLDNYAVWRSVRHLFGRRRLYKIIREGNYTSFPGLYGYLFRHCNTLPLASTPRGLRAVIDSTVTLLRRGERVLIYPEQAMWWNYRKPRPCKPGAYCTAVRAGVPVVPFFLTLKDSGRVGADGFPIPIHTVHILPPLYPDPTLREREATERLAEENYAAWCRTYREVYGIPVRYGEVSL